MLKYLKEEQNKTTTENGCCAYKSTESRVLDFFSSAGAMRKSDDKDIVEKFAFAFGENKLLAMKCLFFARDIRGGLGERRLFRIISEWLVKNEPEVIKSNFDCFVEYGRYDDLINLVKSNIGDDVIKYISDILYNDIKSILEGKNPSLLAKWMPSENTSSEESRMIARKIIKTIGISPRSYRKTLVKLRNKINIIENNLREKDYTFDYSKQPSQAMMKYRKAFIRNDSVRYEKYLEDVSNGKVKMNTSTLTPVDIVSKCYDNGKYYFGVDDLRDDISAKEIKALDVAWNNLEDYTTDEDSIVVVDGSGSMYSSCSGVKPAHVAQALGLYFAEHNKGKFKNHFITFGNRPQLVEVPSNMNIFEKVECINKFTDYSNTDIERTFDLILDVAVKNHLSQKELPKRMYIVSDMQFDSCFYDDIDVFNTAYNVSKNKFRSHGYEIPEVVFWNVNECGNVPVTMNESGVALVSGYTARLFGMITSNNMNPYQVMLDILNSDRYNMVNI